MLKDKRGVELGWQFLFNLLFVIAIIIIISIWINNQASGDAIKKQVLAKEICMIVTSVEPGTKIMIEQEKNIVIEKEGSAIVIKKGEFDRGYSYDCYIKDNVKFSKKDNFTIIEIK